jgi:hypothetical protein
MATHEKDVLFTFEVSEIPTWVPLHMDVPLVLVITGVGLTVIVTVCIGPLHPLKEGVTV